MLGRIVFRRKMLSEVVYNLSMNFSPTIRLNANKSGRLGLETRVMVNFFNGYFPIDEIRRSSQ